MKPIIGLTSQYNQLEDKTFVELNSTYVNAIEAAGGTAIIIPLLKEAKDLERYIDLIDGLVITGGADINPLSYGENPLKDTKVISFERDNMEFGLLKLAMEKSMPVLGICRGLQLINAALGGSLYQDIPSQLPDAYGHESPKTMKDGYHEINLINDGYLYKIFEEEKIIVNSLHHQAIKRLAEGLKISAKSQDGIIEAVESNDNKNIYGVQFHPEALSEKNKKFLKIFEYFMKKL